ncbi:MAG: hypothetical protein Q9168_001810 [Polycauliona sp. 1 TL-2023]
MAGDRLYRMLTLWTQDPEKLERKLRKAAELRESKLFAIVHGLPLPATTDSSGEPPITQGGGDQPRAMTLQDMYHHIMGLSRSKVSANWEDVIRLWNEQEGKWRRARVTEPNLYTHMLFFDMIFFERQLQRRITLEWDNTLVGEHGVCTTQPHTGISKIAIRPRGIDCWYDRNHILGTLLHEMLHVVEELPQAAGCESTALAMHQMGFGHGPMWRKMATRIQFLADGLLDLTPLIDQVLAAPPDLPDLFAIQLTTKWDLGILTAHEGEVRTFGRQNPSTLPGWEDWDFDQIHGWNEPNCLTSADAHELDIELQWIWRGCNSK